MQENNKLITNIDNINNKIKKILENNLIANLIIIAIGVIASLAMTIYSYLNIVNIDKLIDSVYSTSNFNIFFIDTFYFFFSKIFILY